MSMLWEGKEAEKPEDPAPKISGDQQEGASGVPDIPATWSPDKEPEGPKE